MTVKLIPLDAAHVLHELHFPNRLAVTVYPRSIEATDVHGKLEMPLPIRSDQYAVVITEDVLP